MYNCKIQTTSTEQKKYQHHSLKFVSPPSANCVFKDSRKIWLKLKIFICRIQLKVFYISSKYFQVDLIIRSMTSFKIFDQISLRCTLSSYLCSKNISFYSFSEKIPCISEDLKTQGSYFFLGWDNSKGVKGGKYILSTVNYCLSHLRERDPVRCNF